MASNWLAWLLAWSLPISQRAKRVVVVTGAGAGVGLALVTRLDAAGYTVVATARAPAALEALRRQLSSRAIVHKLDVTSETDAAALADMLAQRFPQGVHALVNNAGVVQTGQVEWLDVAHFRRTMEANYFGMVIVTKAMLRLLRESRGRIVNISSISGTLVAHDYGSYAPTKFAVEAFSDALRRELAPFGVQVIVVVPGLLRTAMVDNAVLDDREAIYRKLPADVQAAYGDDFVRVSRERLQLLYRDSYTVEDAIAVLFRAVNHASPSAYLYVGFLTRIYCMCCNLLPPFVMDLVLAAMLGAPIALNQYRRPIATAP